MDERLLDLHHFNQESSVDIYNNAYEEPFKETFQEVWENCALESIYSIFTSTHKLIFINLAIGLVTSLGLPEAVFHIISALAGIYMLLTTVQSSTGLIVVFCAILFSYAAMKFYSYMALRGVSKRHKMSGAAVQYILIGIFVLFQYVLLEKDTWLEIRGIMMVFAMKFISTVSDLPLKGFPVLMQYIGYMFSSANVLFGPWISFETYMMQAKFPSQKNFLWLWGVFKSILCALIFLTISNCWASYLISDNASILLKGYKEALSFRTSHYFVCYLSESFMLAAGWKNPDFHFDDSYWHFPITNFRHIEFPTSLAQVVVSWNKPMHEFLKKYVYRKWLPSGKFKAIILTFIMSSLFHGFELKVSTVLISLGVFSYLQILVRDHIAQTFDICVRVRPCKSCHHHMKRNSVACKICLVIFSLFCVLHLIFVGVLMDESTDEVGIFRKWSDLNYFSLWIMFINFVLVK